MLFESDFYGLTKGWQTVVKQPDSIQTFLKKNVFSLWTHSDACQYLFNTYTPTSFPTQRPLYPAGIDSQPILDYSLNHLRNDLDQYLRSNQWVQLFAGEVAYQSFLDAVQYLHLLTSVQDPTAFEKATTGELTTGLQLIKKHSSTSRTPLIGVWLLII